MPQKQSSAQAALSWEGGGLSRRQSRCGSLAIASGLRRADAAGQVAAWAPASTARVAASSSSTCTAAAPSCRSAAHHGCRPLNRPLNTHAHPFHRPHARHLWQPTHQREPARDEHACITHAAAHGGACCCVPAPAGPRSSAGSSRTVLAGRRRSPRGSSGPRRSGTRCSSTVRTRRCASGKGQGWAKAAAAEGHSACMQQATAHGCMCVVCGALCLLTMHGTRPWSDRRVTCCWCARSS